MINYGFTKEIDTSFEETVDNATNELKKERISAIFKIFPPLSISACAQVPNGPMGNGGHMMGYGYGGTRQF